MINFSISKDLILGLEVNFYTEKKLVTMLNELASVEVIRSELKMTIFCNAFSHTYQSWLDVMIMFFTLDPVQSRKQGKDILYMS